MRQMKDSGIEWIGEIPVGWDIGKIKYLINFNPRYQGDIDDDELVSFIPMECLTNGKISPKKKRIGDVKKAYTFFAENDIIMAKVTPCFENGNIAVARCLLNGVGFGTSEIFVFRCTEIKTQYFFYFLQNDTFRQLCIGSMYGTGGLKRVSPDFIRDYKFAIPPLSEQTRIASFLDKRCAAIDSAIENQRASIDKLKEYRQAVITEAVTKGLNPDVLMKDSGVEWIGEIPEGWDVCKIKYLAKMKSGDSITSLFIDDDSPYPVYGGNGLRGYTKSFTHNGSYILIGRQGALCGNVHIVKGEFWASEHAVVTYELVSLDQKWLFYILSAMNLNQYSTSAAQPGLSVEQIQKLSTLLPLLSEQHEIAAYLDKKCTAIDETVSGKEKLIEKLEEYKKSLIYEAVTGKIEVPEECGVN